MTDLFVKVPRAIVQDRTKLNTHDKIVYTVLCMFANWETGEAFPSVPTIAADAGISQNSVRNALRRLEVLRLISIETRKKDGGGNASNLYRVLDLPADFSS